jgi:MerR family transcriptional regulator, thiopeptide resistance regulator
MNWSVRAFAELTGVTVKALHHYERRGLLAPRRSRAGYRRYTLGDLAQLDRILALKSLGFPLGQIDALLKGGPLAAAGSRGASAGAGPARALREQRDQLAAMREKIDRAIGALDALARDPEPRRALERFTRDTAWARWEAKRAEMASPAPRAPDRASPSRFALFHEIREALDCDPSGASARPLAARWSALVEAEADGNPDVIAALRKVAASRASWPDGARRYVASLYDADLDTWERVMAFVGGAAQK